MTFNSILKTAALSWREHSGVQTATLVVLTATFTVVISFVSFSYNLKNILQTWGESVQMTAYLKDELGEKDVAQVNQALRAMAEFKEINFVSKDQAKERFASQMANYAPTLLSDGALDNPFPASFQMSFSEQKEVSNLAVLADRIGRIAGVEEVSYGQDWIQNYAALYSAFKWSSLVITLVLILGSLMVVSNSIRASIDRRRDEIEILKLVGATNSTIRRPFVFEGALMGGVAAFAGICFSYAFYLWQLSVVSGSLAFANIASQFQFLPVESIFIILIAGAFIGSLGSYTCVFKTSTMVYTGRSK